MYIYIYIITYIHIWTSYMDIIYGHVCIMFLMYDVVIINNEKS